MAIELSAALRAQQPYSNIGLLWTTWADGTKTIGTCTLVGQNDILTATHCVYNPDKGGWAASFSFNFGADYNATTQRWESYGSVVDYTQYVVTAWPDGTFTDANNATMTPTESQWDVALIGIDRAVGNTLGWLGMSSGYNNGLIYADAVGYPTDGTGMMIENSVAVKANGAWYESSNYVLGPGSSGGPLLASSDGSTKDTVIGVKSTGIYWADLSMVWDAMIKEMADNDVIIVNGTFSGSNANDVFTGGAGNDTIDGGAGIDTAKYTGFRASFTLTTTSTGHQLRDNSGIEGTDTLINVERLQFTDKTIAFDLDGNAGQAYRLYQAAFDRVPDQVGLGYWIDQLDRGMGLSQVATGFINSAEFKALYGNNPSNAEFVTLLYDNVLHRAPDTAGYTYWMNELSHGVSREQALTGFSESTENKVTLMAFDMDGNMGKDYRLYQAAFDRKPDVSGLDYWYHQMNSGMALQQVASGFINSAEFKTLYGNNPSNAELVTLLYDNVLHRAPDTSGFNYWMNELDHGTSREDALIGFSESLENQLSLVGIVQTGVEFA